MSELSDYPPNKPGPAVPQRTAVPLVLSLSSPLSPRSPAPGTPRGHSSPVLLSRPGQAPPTLAGVGLNIERCSPHVVRSVAQLEFVGPHEVSPHAWACVCVLCRR